MEKEIETKRGRGVEGGRERRALRKEASGPQEMEPPLATPNRRVAYPGGFGHLVLS